jgi:hypothetical protein
VVEKDDELTWKNRGNGLAKQGNYEGAIACYNTGLGINPTNTDILHNKSAVLLKLGRYDEAQECIRQIQVLKNPPTAERKPIINDEVPIISSPPPSKPQDIEEISYVVEKEKVSNPPKTDNTNFKKAFCRYCGSELKFSEAEICPNCGMRIKDLPISVIPEVTYETNNILIGLFFVGLFFLFVALVGYSLGIAGIIIAFGASIFLIIIVLLSAILGYFDAKSIGESRGGAFLVCLGILFFWILVLPIYIITRKGEFHKNMKKNKLTES